MSEAPCPISTASPYRLWQTSSSGEASSERRAASAISRLFSRTFEIDACTSKSRTTSFDAFPRDTLLAIGPASSTARS